MIPFAFIELAEFTVAWRRLGLSDDDLSALQQQISADPEGAPVMGGTAGLRKVRFAPAGRGKRGAYRVCYFLFVRPGVVVLATAYGKNDKANLTLGDKARMRALAGELKKELDNGE